MRFARFMNWCRQLVGLPRKPIHYQIKAKGFHIGTKGRSLGG